MQKGVSSCVHPKDSDLDTIQASVLRVVAAQGLCHQQFFAPWENIQQAHAERLSEHAWPCKSKPSLNFWSVTLRCAVPRLDVLYCCFMDVYSQTMVIPAA